MNKQTALHTLNKPDSATRVNLQLSETISPEDSVLLIEDGVYQILTFTKSTDSANAWQTIAHKVFALADDMSARGIAIPASLDITPLSYEEFVEQTVKHDKVVSWY